MVEKEVGRVATPLEVIFIKRDYKDPSHPGDVRTAFQHDRDRILHSTAFRRLQYKTQVYMIHEGDMYRTRMTHTLEVAQIAKGLAQSLKADCDLTEAIAFAHDIGHTPFGHAGEKKLGELLKPFGIPFNHNIQSYRVLSRLEERYGPFSGLNLTYAVYEGILRHNTYFDEEEQIKRDITDDIRDKVLSYWDNKRPGIEAQIVNMADIIAYAVHDIEDALATGLIMWGDFREKIREKNIEFVDKLMREAGAKVQKAGQSKDWELKVRPRILARLMISILIRETAKQTKENISTLNSGDGKLYEEIRKLDSQVVTLPPPLETQVRTLVTEVLLDDVYKEPRVVLMEEKAKVILDLLFKTFLKQPKALHKNTQARWRRYKELTRTGELNLSKKKVLPTVIGDYISGMTDKYAMDLYQLLTQPYEKAL